jgi:hypothetical protein
LVPIKTNINNSYKGMRDTRIYSILVLVLSVFFCLCLAFLVWNFNNRTVKADSKPTPTPPVPSGNITSAITADTRDSLQKIYAATVNYLNTKMETPPDSSGMGEPAAKTNEFDRLKNEITALLKERATEADLDLAKQKIAELQLKVAQLYSRNKDIEEENRRLSALLAQLAQSPRNADIPVRQEAGTRTVNTKAPSAAPVFAASDLRLQAVYASDEGEQETTVADDAEKLNGSFVVKGSAIQQGFAVVHVVVIQPNGQVLKNSAWESGAFETAEGRKIYSYQLRFDYAKGETKPLRFSLGGDRFMQGNYIMQLYYNGHVIGKLTKALM